jgi:hypothetical protein
VSRQCKPPQDAHKSNVGDIGAFLERKAAHWSMPMVYARSTFERSPCVVCDAVSRIDLDHLAASVNYFALY